MVQVDNYNFPAADDQPQPQCGFEKFNDSRISLIYSKTKVLIERAEETLQLCPKCFHETNF